MDIANVLPRGCELCVQGKKVQIHTTFRCNKKCGFCPVPAGKFGTDVIEIEDRAYDPLTLDSTLERLMPAWQDKLGAALSGGEPTLVFDRVMKIIARLKGYFGKNFHIHLYTNGVGLTTGMVNQLSRSGLDELRVNSLNPAVFEKLADSSLDVICEVPCLPSANYVNALLRLIGNFPRLRINRLNLNEAEVTRENHRFLEGLGMIADGTKIKGSKEAAARIIERCVVIGGINVFFCSYEIADQIRITRNRT